MFRDPYGILKILSHPEPEAQDLLSLAQRGLKNTKTQKPMLSQEKTPEAIHKGKRSL